MSDSGGVSGALIPSDVSKFVRARQWSYYGLIGLSALVLVFLKIVGPEWYWITRLSVPMVSGLMGPLAAETIERSGYFIDASGWLCILYGISMLVSEWTYRSMNDTFSRFWRSRLRPWLRERPDYLLVEAFFLTNRNAMSGTELAFGSSRGTLSGGVSRVSIPLQHRLGIAERPRAHRFELKEDPKKHIVVCEVNQFDLDSTLRAIGKRAATANGELLLFIPGAAHTFSEAVRSVAQLSYDLRFDGVAVVYSWPASSTVTGYQEDESNAQWASEDLSAVLSKFRGLPGVQRVHVVAHGMGGRMLVSVAHNSVTTLRGDETNLVDQLALVLPDVGVDVFRESSESLLCLAKRVTVYVSSKDKTLALSAQIHGYPLAGQSIAKVAAANGVDTIDLTVALDSLWNYGHMRAAGGLLQDLCDVLRGVEVSKRLGLLPVTFDGVNYWRMLP